MKSGKNNVCKAEFATRKFWSALIWIVLLVVFGTFGVVFNSFSLFYTVLVACFIGLNETRCFNYKTNLTICATAGAVASIISDFNLAEIISIFFLFIVISAYMFYFKEKTVSSIVNVSKFADSFTHCRTFRELIECAYTRLYEIAPNFAVFIVLADDDGNLFVPAHFKEDIRQIKRMSGITGKTFISGRRQITSNVSAERDLPLDMDALSIIAVPLTSRGEKLGVLQLESGKMYAFDKDDKAKLSMIAFALSNELYMHIFETIPTEGEKTDANN